VSVARQRIATSKNANNGEEIIEFFEFLQNCLRRGFPVATSEGSWEIFVAGEEESNRQQEPQRCGVRDGGGREADFSAAPFAKARTASVEMTVLWWDEKENNKKLMTVLWWDGKGTTKS